MGGGAHGPEWQQHFVKTFVFHKEKNVYYLTLIWLETRISDIDIKIK